MSSYSAAESQHYVPRMSRATCRPPRATSWIPSHPARVVPVRGRGDTHVRGESPGDRRPGRTNGRPTRRPGGDGDGDVLRHWPTNPVDGQCRTSDPSSVPSPIAVAESIRLGSHGGRSQWPRRTGRSMDGRIEWRATGACTLCRPVAELNDVVGLGRPGEGPGRIGSVEKLVCCRDSHQHDEWQDSHGERWIDRCRRQRRAPRCPPRPCTRHPS